MIERAHHDQKSLVLRGRHQLRDLSTKRATFEVSVFLRHIGGR